MKKMKTQYTRNLQDAAKAVLPEKFVVVTDYIKKDLKSLTFQFQKLEKEEQTKAQTNRKEKIMKTRTEINEVEKRTIEKINKTKVDFLKISK